MPRQIRISSERSPTNMLDLQEGATRHFKRSRRDTVLSKAESGILVPELGQVMQGAFPLCETRCQYTIIAENKRHMYEFSVYQFLV